jgi:hypothetical protein
MKYEEVGKMSYYSEVLNDLYKVFGTTIPKYIAASPYGGGRIYYEDNEARNSGFFVFDSEEEIDSFIRNNPHCYYLKVGNIIY